MNQFHTLSFWIAYKSSIGFAKSCPMILVEIDLKN